MNKKLNTLFFVLGATVFNILVTVLAFLLLSSVFVWLLLPRLPDAAAQMGFALVFLMAIAASFLVYRLVLNKIISRIKFEDYFDPILRGRRPPPKKRND